MRLVVFGARGDLSARKLFPALYHLERASLLPEDMQLVLLAREALAIEAFLEALKARVAAQLDSTFWSEAIWQRFAARCEYCELDFSRADDFQALAARLPNTEKSIFYLATPPSLYSQICEHLGEQQCLNEQSQIVLEKPIGHDLSSCKQVNETVARYFSEENTYRIDHYLGKETVQNLLALRFANRFINAQWDQSCIDHVQITVAETVGIEGRWSYYDSVGQLRDMVQNHLLQLLCLVAMEPPNSMTADSIRDEKIKILRALRPIDESHVQDHIVRGQYSAGWHNGEGVPGYLQEPGCADCNSDTESFVAIKAYIDNWRWAGVPFYIRTGKRMAEKLTEIVITYKSLPHNIFSQTDNSPNRLVIRLQPNEGIEMQMQSKQHSLTDKMSLETRNLNLDFLTAEGMSRIPDAYERLFLDVFRGDQSLFVGREEVEEAWRWCDLLVHSWQRQGLAVRPYHAGSWGPAKAEILIEKDGRSWYE